jgi:hypothetical protein
MANTPMKTVKSIPLTGLTYFLIMCSPVQEQQKSLSQLDRRASEVRMYAQKHGYSTRYCFLLDMSLQSGLKRFFVYDLSSNMVAFSGLVAHGSCDQDFLKEARFSNTPGGQCTSLGLYKVGRSYYGQYGKSYKLHGLQRSNSNAFSRAIVIHGNNFVPDQETYPKPICNSSGCPMVSFSFLDKLSGIVDKSSKPVLLWVFGTPSNPVAAMFKSTTSID